MHILLVHGAFHDQRCWRHLRPHLERHFDVHTVTLRGHSDRRVNPYRVRMTDYTQDVCDAAAEIGQRCVLLGHSMGGFVISAAAEQQSTLFHSLIYLAALVPNAKPGSLMTLQRTLRINNLNAATRPMLNGAARIDSEKAKPIFYNQCSTELQQQAALELCPQPLRPTLFGKVGWTPQNTGSLPRYYIECTNDNALTLLQQRRMQEHMPFDRIATLESDHSPFLSMPELLADCIADFYR